MLPQPLASNRACSALRMVANDCPPLSLPLVRPEHVACRRFTRRRMSRQARATGCVGGQAVRVRCVLHRARFMAYSAEVQGWVSAPIHKGGRRTGSFGAARRNQRAKKVECVERTSRCPMPLVRPRARCGRWSNASREMLLYCLPREDTVATARGNHAVHVDACHIWGGVRDRWPREGRGMGFTCRQR